MWTMGGGEHEYASKYTARGGAVWWRSVCVCVWAGGGGGGGGVDRNATLEGYTLGRACEAREGARVAEGTRGGRLVYGSAGWLHGARGQCSGAVERQ